MILSQAAKKNVILQPRNENLPGYKKQHDRLNLFFNGSEQIAEYLDKIQDFENDSQRKLRQRLARSPKDTLKKSLNPFKKVFTASGGSQSIKLGNKAKEEQFKELLANLPEGMPLRKWMEVYWSEAYCTDPNGLILIETEATDNPRSYPTYKNIGVIHDYISTWKKVEYVVLEYGEREVNETLVSVYRIIDDEVDGLYYLDRDEDIKEYLLEGPTIIHNKGFVPAVIVSDLVDKRVRGKKKSFIDCIDELVDEFMRDSSVLSIYKYFHLYPKYWQYVGKCGNCQGEGFVVENDEQTQCPSCLGNRYHIKKDVSDGVYLPLPDTEDPVIAPHIAGFIAPPIAAWEKMVEELERMEKAMHLTLWGTHLEDQKAGNPETATGRYIDSQPVIDALRSISDSAENIEYQIAFNMAKWMFPDAEPDFEIGYGKRFMVEQPDQLWKKYIDAKTLHAPITTLDQHYREYLLAQYHNDRETYDQKIKEFHLEPFVHYTLEELKDIIKPEEMKRKIYFGEWISEVTDFTKPVEILKTDFENFLATKPDTNENITKDTLNREQGEDPGTS